MSCEAVCLRTPCYPLRLLHTGRYCSTTIDNNDDDDADDDDADDDADADAATLSANTSCGQLPVWWRSGGLSVWGGIHESYVLSHLWFLQNCTSGSDHTFVIFFLTSFLTLPSPNHSSSSHPVDFISHSFSISELQFLFEIVLPDLTGRNLVDVGSRLGAVLYGVSRPQS